MKRLTLMCHLCGKPLPDYFTAVSPADATDRPFLTHRDCVKQVQSDFARVDVETRREPSAYREKPQPKEQAPVPVAPSARRKK